jgi:hypothetical protein
VGVLIGLCLLSLAFVGPRVWRATDEGRTALTEAGRAVLRRDAAAARVEFAAARDLFDSADERLRSPLAWPLRFAPVASTHMGVARSLTRIGIDLSDAGLAIADTMEDLPEQSLAFRDGKVNLDEVRRSRSALRIASTMSTRIDAAIADMPSGWVGGPLSEPRKQAQELLPGVLEGVRRADAALGGLPSILAENGRKRYLVAFSNLSELRGSGGLFGFVTSLRATDGDLDLEGFQGRPTEIFPEPGGVGLDYPEWFPPYLREQAEIFQNINMTTDFPTVGRFVLQTAEADGAAYDGVIAVDPIGIGAVLAVTGPIRVEGWPQMITASNVAKVAMHDVYVSVEDNQRREEFFGELVRTAFEKLTTSTVRFSAASAGVFDLAVRGGHFRMYSEHEADQGVFERIGAAGGVSRSRQATDVLSVVSQNAGGNKIDWFLRRDLRYRVAIDPDTGTATGTVGATFRNTAPSTGLPDYVIGSLVPGLPRGTNRQVVMVLRGERDDLRSLEVDGKNAVTVTDREGHLSSYRSTIEAGPRDRSELTATTRVPGALVGRADERVYRLHVLRQAVANPDFLEVEITVPAGWVAVGRTTYLGDLTQDQVFEVRVRRTLVGSIADTLIGEPLRFAKRLLSLSG